MKKRIAIVGGGAAGMMAAITAAKAGAKVTIYEHTDRLGKKILSTGNGKCNLSNREMDEKCFNSSDQALVKKCLERFSVEETVGFFISLGLCIKDKNGYLYPLAEQAAVVLDVLRYTIEKLSIEVLYQTQVRKIYGVNEREGNRICVENGKEKAYYHSVIIACGSMAAPKTGSDGSGYELARRMGHTIQPVLPALVQLKCNDSFCKAIAGIRCDAQIHIFAGKEKICEERGELQLTDYGISGIPVFQLSGLVNKYMLQNRGCNMTAKIDFLPDYSIDDLDKLFKERCKSILYQKGSVEEFFTGVLNKKLMQLFIRQAGLQPGAGVCEEKAGKLQKVFELCKSLEMHITGSNGFDNAQVCTGGIPLTEVSEQLESKKMKGVFFAGEILDVDGRCGGYNLQWAWTSGVIAGEVAIK